MRIWNKRSMDENINSSLSILSTPLQDMVWIWASRGVVPPLHSLMAQNSLLPFGMKVLKKTSTNGRIHSTPFEFPLDIVSTKKKKKNFIPKSMLGVTWFYEQIFFPSNRMDPFGLHHYMCISDDYTGHGLAYWWIECTTTCGGSCCWHWMAKCPTDLRMKVSFFHICLLSLVV